MISENSRLSRPLTRRLCMSCALTAFLHCVLVLPCLAGLRPALAPSAVPLRRVPLYLVLHAARISRLPDRSSRLSERWSSSCWASVFCCSALRSCIYAGSHCTWACTPRPHHPRATGIFSPRATNTMRDEAFGARNRDSAHGRGWVLTSSLHLKLSDSSRRRSVTPCIGLLHMGRENTRVDGRGRSCA